jgi:hypothetical protein
MPKTTWPADASNDALSFPHGDNSRMPIPFTGHSIEPTPHGFAGGGEKSIYYRLTAAATENPA